MRAVMVVDVRYWRALMVDVRYNPAASPSCPAMRLYILSLHRLMLLLYVFFAGADLLYHFSPMLRILSNYVVFSLQNQPQSM